MINICNLFIIASQENKQFIKIFVIKKKQKASDITFEFYIKGIIIIKNQLFDVFQKSKN